MSSIQSTLPVWQLGLLWSPVVCLLAYSWLKGHSQKKSAAYSTLTFLSVAVGFGISVAVAKDLESLAVVLSPFVLSILSVPVLIVVEDSLTTKESVLNLGVSLASTLAFVSIVLFIFGY